MCEICKLDGVNYLFKNGPKKNLTSNYLYKVFKDMVAPIKLCHVHSIELFHVGEKRFLSAHLNYAHAVATRSNNRSSDSDFGL